MKVTGHHKCVHVLVEPSPKCWNIFVLENTTELKPGGSQVDVVLWNLLQREVTLGTPHQSWYDFSCQQSFTNIGTGSVTQDDEDDEKIQCKSVQVDLTKSESKQVKVDPEEILQKVDLSGTTDWNPAEQWEAHILIHEYACIFLWNDLDLSKTLIVKHSIKVTDYTLFKECYWCIRLGMNEEVKAHIQEMLDIGAIHPSNSLGQVLWF